MQGIDLAVQHFFYFFYVIKHAIVCRLRDGQHARFGFFVGNKGIDIDFLLDVFPSKFALRYRAYDAEMVARWHQEYRHRTGHDDGVQYGFMAISIDDDDVTRRYRAVPDHFVGGGGAVGDKIQVVAIVNASGIAFGGSNWSSVVQ